MILFEINRFNFFKIFETHQFKSFLSFPDVANVCTLLKICPDLIDIQGIQKIFLSISAGGYSKITLVEFEDLIKTLASSIFSNESTDDPLKSFITHIKDSAFNTYGITLHTSIKPKKKSAKSIIIRSSQDLKPSSTSQKSLKKHSNTPKKLLNSAIIQYQEVNPSHLKKTKSSQVFTVKKVSPKDSLRALKAKLKNLSIKSFIFSRKLRNIQYHQFLYRELQIIKRLYFLVWKLS